MSLPIKISFIFIIFTVVVNASNNNFDAITLTDVGAAPNIKVGDLIDCKILNIERNVTYKLVNQGFEDIYNTSSGELKNITITSDCWKFSIYKYENSSFIWSKFRIIEAIGNSSYYFIIAENGVQIYRVHTASENIEWERYIHAEKLLPMRRETKFWIQYKRDHLLFGSEIFITKLPIENYTRPHTMQIESDHVSSAVWKINDCHNSTVNFDKFITFCWNSTHNDTGNLTATYFTTLIETQYRIQNVMEKDLRDFKDWDNSKMIKEFIEEFLSDVKDNYESSYQTHRLILRYYKLNKYEISVKDKYLKNRVFETIRRTYFELYKSAQLILSRFR